MMSFGIWSRTKYIYGEWWVCKWEAEQKINMGIILAALVSAVVGFVVGAFAL